MSKRPDVILTVIDDEINAWGYGNAECDGRLFCWETKHFEEGSEFGIKGGRISKLHIFERDGNGSVVRGRDEICYDRGWCRGSTPRGKCAEIRAVYNELVRRYN